MTKEAPTPEATTRKDELICSVCGKSSKVVIEGKEYGPYYSDEDEDDVACIYCAADEKVSDFYSRDYQFSGYEETDFLKDLFKSGVLYMESQSRP
jgi:uncharacterized protein CbrC (UPF0167 family)